MLGLIASAVAVTRLLEEKRRDEAKIQCPVCGLGTHGEGDYRACVDPSCICANAKMFRFMNEKPEEEEGNG